MIPERNTDRGRPRGLQGLTPGVLAGFAAVVIVLIAARVIGVMNLREVYTSTRAVAHSSAAKDAFRRILAAAVDAETSERGFIITGNAIYLEAYDRARASLAATFAQARMLAAEHPEQRPDLERLSAAANAKLTELAEAIRQRESGASAAPAGATTSVGKRSMDDMRATVARMDAREDALLSIGAARSAQSYRSGFVSGLASTAVALLSVVALFLVTRRLGVERLRASELTDAARASEKRAADDLRDMRLLRDVGDLCARSGSSLTMCLDEILGAAIGLTRAEKGNIQLLDESGALVIAAQRGFDAPFLQFFTRVHAESASACGAAMLAVRRTVVEDVDQSEVFAGQPSLDVLRDAGVRAVQSTPLVSSNGTVSGMISTHFSQPHRPLERELQLMDLLARPAADYLERKLASDALAARTVEAEAANRAKAQFVANMSHDLRTPLNAIMGYSDLLSVGVHGSLTTTQTADVSAIMRNSRHLLKLIEDTLDFAKLDAGRLQFEIEDVDLRRALAGVVPLVAPQMREKGLAFSYDCEPGLVVSADPTKLEQILVNLLGNALKFTESGGCIELACSTAADHVRVDVRDTGQGIPADQLDKVFEPFVQVVSRAEKREGSGLGLSISRHLARGMRGDVHVRSVVGEGTTFSLRLPRSLPAERAGIA